MAFARLETTTRNHRKFRRLDAGAIGLWAMGLIYCQDQLTDGLIEADEASLLLPPTPANRSRLPGYVKALLDGELWEQDGTNYRVHDYLQWNPSRAQVLQDRAAAQSRMRAFRSGERSPHVQSNIQSTFADGSAERTPNEQRTFADGSAERTPNEQRTFAVRSPFVRRSFAVRSRQDVDVDVDVTKPPKSPLQRSGERSGEQRTNKNGERFSDGQRVGWPGCPDGARCAHGCKPDDTSHICVPD